jgi:hypothetical protein
MDADRSTLPAGNWINILWIEANDGFRAAAEATTARPVVLFAVAASMAIWIEAGWITEDEVVDRLLDAASTNGALSDYGEDELKRQIRNGIDAGKSEKRL